jgi:hypothetical protein
MTIAPPLPSTTPTTLREIDPLLIDFDPTQPRQEIDPEAQADLEASVPGGQRARDERRPRPDHGRRKR